MIRGLSTAFLAAWLVGVGGALHGVAGEMSGPLSLTVERVTEGRNPRGGLLAEELARQAVLLAAREAFGATTRDQVLGERLPETGRRYEAQVEVGFDSVDLAIRCSSTGTSLFLSAPWLAGDQGETDYSTLVALADGWSRRELPAWLRGQGWVESALPWQETGATHALADWVPLEPWPIYGALRQLHQEIRERGASPERLAALVRGYATLGQLTRYHWSAAEQVFAARALLYAQRLVNQTGASPDALQHRAYVWALLGLDALAAADLQAAGAEGGAPWAALLDAFTQHRTADLERMGEAPGVMGDWARYLRFLLAERLHELDSTRRWGDWALERQPHLLRVIHAMAEQGGVSNLHQQTRRAPDALLMSLTQTLPTLSGVPTPVQQRVARVAREPWPGTSMVDLGRALRTAEDPQELSWDGLARLIEDSHFITVFQRAHFKKFMWAVPVEDLIDRAMPSLTGHRHAPIIASLRLATDRQGAAIDAMMMEVPFGDLTVAARSLFRRSWWGRHEARSLYTERWRQMTHELDATAQDLSFSLRQWTHTSRPYRLRHLRELEAASPASPVAMASRLTLLWEEAQAELSPILARFGEEPLVLQAAIEQLQAHDRAAETGPLLERYVALTGSYWGYERLAAQQLAEGNEVGWLATLERYLEEGEDGGLTRPQVCDNIARHFMAQGRFAEALPYAEAGAQSWAGWAMHTAADCSEGLEDWAGAERWMRRLSERYDNSRLDWYWWCLRTDRGDLAAARALAREHLAAVSENANWVQRSAMGNFLFLEGDRPGLQTWLEKEMSQDPLPGVTFHLYLLAEKMGEPRHRAQATERLLALEAKERSSKDATRRAIAQVIGAMLPQGVAPRAEPDLAAVDVALTELSERDRVTVAYYLAEMLKLQGHPRLARTYQQQCVTEQPGGSMNQALAYHFLRQDGLNPRQILRERP